MYDYDYEDTPRCWGLREQERRYIDEEIENRWRYEE